MNKLGYSYLISERNNEKLYSLNQSIEDLMKSNDILKQFSSIQFELEGNMTDNNLKLVINYKTKKGKDGQKLFSSHIDDGAIEVTESIIQAYFGMNKYNEVKKELDKNYGIFEADYLKSNEPEFYNQLAEEYLLQCSPDIDNGAEFTIQDELLFLEILNQDYTSPYDAKIELNEYIEKMSEIKPLLDQICENLNNKKVLVVNDGCDEYLVRKVVGYLENHGIVVQFN